MGITYRKKVKGVNHGMTGKNINSKQKDDPESHWVFSKRQKRQIFARVADI